MFYCCDIPDHMLLIFQTKYLKAAITESPINICEISVTKHRKRLFLLAYATTLGFLNPAPMAWIWLSRAPSRLHQQWHRHNAYGCSTGQWIDFHQIFRLCLPQKTMKLIRFWQESDNTSYHCNMLCNICGINTQNGLGLLPELAGYKR